MTGQAGFEAVVNAINNARLYRYIAKPWEANDFILTITEAARSFQYSENNRILRALNQATQEISKEIETQKLGCRLLQSILQNIGAEKGFLLNNVQGHISILAAVLPELGGRTADSINDEKNKIIQRLPAFLNANLKLEIPDERVIFAIIHTQQNNISYLWVENGPSAEPFTINHR